MAKRTLNTCNPYAGMNHQKTPTYSKVIPPVIGTATIGAGLVACQYSQLAGGFLMALGTFNLYRDIKRIRQKCLEDKINIPPEYTGVGDSTFSDEETKRIIDAKLDSQPKQIKIIDFYEHFGIKAEKSRNIGQITEACLSGSEIQWAALVRQYRFLANEDSYADFKANRLANIIKTYLNYEIPLVLTDVIEERHAAIDKDILETYSKLYNEPKATVGLNIGFKHTVRKIRNFFRDTSIFISSGMKGGIVYEGNKEFNKRRATMAFQKIKEDNEEIFPKFVESLLWNYLKFVDYKGAKDIVNKKQ